MREALRAGRPLDRILIARGAGGPRLQEIIDAARERSVPVRFEPREALDRASNNATHQGVLAFGAARQYADLERILSGTPQLVVVLDGVEDPHNLGAIVRSAHAAGAAAVLIPERRAAPLTETVAKAAAGALEHPPVVRIGNVTQTLEELKRRGFWIYGLDERARDLYSDTDFARPTAFVLGAEGQGLHQLVKQHCDALVRIPMAAPSRRSMFRWRPGSCCSSGAGETELAEPSALCPGHLRPELANLAARIVFHADFFVENHGGARLGIVARPVRNFGIIRIAVLRHAHPGVGEARP